MIAELLLGAFFGLLAGIIISWFANRIRQNKIKNPEKIVTKLQKQEKEGFKFFTEGNELDWKKQISAKEKVDQHIEELRKKEEQKPYTSPDVPPLPPQNVDVAPEKPKEEPKKKSSNSLNKMLGRR